jgi:hypothetical protein
MIARHTVEAPFACNGPLELVLVSFGYDARHPQTIVERCQSCGRVTGVWGVLAELRMVPGSAPQGETP